MVLSILGGLNLLLGIYDTYLTQRRIKLFGPWIELNWLVRELATQTGPTLAAIIGVLGPVVVWTAGLVYFKFPVFLALLAGINLKRFEMQLASTELEQKFRLESASLPDGESTPQSSRSKFYVNHQRKR